LQRRSHRRFPKAGEFGRLQARGPAQVAVGRGAAPEEPPEIHTHPVQQAFVDHDALQCGYCTPGMILSAVSLLAENPQASDEEIAVGLDDNLCRCGAHQSIVKAVRSVAQKPKA